MHRGGKTRLLHRVGDSGKRVAWSSSERKAVGSVEDYLDRCAALVRARRSRGLSKVHLEVRDERRQQYFPALRHKREKAPLRGKQNALVGAPRREGSPARKLAK